MKTIKNNNCRTCESKKFSIVINLGRHPLVNSLIEKKDLDKNIPTFPLVVKQCQVCKLVQLVEIIDSKEIYKKVDYLYFSSDMPGLNSYFKSYAEDLKKRFLKEKDLVIEIGCNDGIMLKNFKKNYRVLGIDPATNVVLRTIKRGIPCLPLFFSENLAKKIYNEWGNAKLIYGNNCIAHLNDLKDLMNGINILLRNDGIFVLECNYWGGMVKNTNYSLIYHDHYSYFSAYVWEKFLKNYNMKIYDAFVTPAQGGSLRLFICKNDRKPTKRYKDLIKEEKDTRLNSYTTSKLYAKNVKKTALKLRKLIIKLKKNKKIIAGYGAAAKGMTILKCSGIGNKHLEYFVDDSPAKHKKYAPIDHIPIISRKDAEKKSPNYFIILAPNYTDIIIKKEKKFINSGGKFITLKDGIGII